MLAKEILNRIAGPVVVFSADSQRDFGPHNSGCGHFQYILMGPQLEAVFRFVLEDARLRACVNQNGQCRQCSKSLRGVVILVEQSLISDMELRYLVHPLNIPCPVKRISDGLADAFLRDRNDDEVSEAGRRVVCYW